MTIGISPGQLFALLFGFGAIAGLSFHYRVWAARKERIHKEAAAFSGRRDHRE